MILGLDQDYIPFGLRNNRKGDWKRQNTFWNNLVQPVNIGRVWYDTGRVRYERDYKNRAYPFSPKHTCLLQTNQPTPFFSPRVTKDFTKEKSEREIALEKAWIKD